MYHGSEVAVIGMSGRFPGADNISQFWNNLLEGKESVRFFSEAQLKENGVSDQLLKMPGYVRAKAVLDNADLFDAIWFGYTPLEAKVMDPQHRIFLEECFKALEDAGYDTERFAGNIGLYGGADTNTYLINNLLPNSYLLQTMGGLQMLIANEKSHMVTRTSYKLNLKGPSVNVQTACSTGLVCIHMACQGLISGESDMALAGAVSIGSPSVNGYLFQPGMLSSQDGHCRPFDEKADGSVNGDGVGVVVLKLLENALEDGDDIYAVIKASAVNNDGANKESYTSPGTDGQVKVIAEALAIAEIPATSVRYIEANGTASILGDAIEVEALSRAFHPGGTTARSCGIGSVKSNIGHLNEASGMAGFIKTVCILRHGQVPASINYQSPNKTIQFDKGPYYVVNKNEPLQKDGAIARAGVNAFGIGGTNAHIILEEFPVAEAEPPAAKEYLVIVSAWSATALKRTAEMLAAYLHKHPQTSLAAFEYTLQMGRRISKFRYSVTGNNTAAIAEKLKTITTDCLPASSQNFEFVIEADGISNHNTDLFTWLQHNTGLAYDVAELAKTTWSKTGKQLKENEMLQFGTELALLKWLELKGVKGAVAASGKAELVMACYLNLLTVESALQMLALIQKGEAAENICMITGQHSFAQTDRSFYSRGVSQKISKDSDFQKWTRSLCDEQVAGIEKKVDKKSVLHICTSDLCSGIGSAATNICGSLLERLGKYWEKGLAVNWKQFNHGNRASRIHLPSAPFNPQSYWLKGVNLLGGTFQQPMSSNGEAAVDKMERVLINPYVEPQSSGEMAMKDIWSELFGYQQIGIRDNFFEMGGHSLLAMQILTKVRESMHISLPAAVVFQKPTIEEMAEYTDFILWAIEGTGQGEGINDSMLLSETGII